MNKSNASSAETLVAIPHEDLVGSYLVGVRELFNREYFEEDGEWSAHQPYGYAAHDIHIIALHGETVVGHVGWARRQIEVGKIPLTIGGIGGVLVAPQARGDGLAKHLMSAATDTMKLLGGIDFGYLGCREEVADFYKSCGWYRISADEEYINPLGDATVDSAGSPLFIYSIEKSENDWPAGTVKLHGRAW